MTDDTVTATTDPAECLRGRAVLEARGGFDVASFGAFADVCELVGDIVEAHLGRPPVHILDGGYGWGISHLLWLTRWPESLVYCISPEPPGPYADGKAHGVFAMTNTERDHFRFQLGRMEFARHLCHGTARGGFDFVFVDTEHDYPAQYYQVAAALAVLRPGGIVAGHDYDQFRVRAGTDEAMREHGLTATEIPADDGSNFWYALTPKEEER